MLRKTLFVVPALLSGCLSNVVALSPEAKKVQIVHETDKPLRCDVLGRITGQSRSTDGKEAQTGAENDFRNQAASFEANFALVETERNNRVGTSSQRDVFLGGKALRCMTEEMEEAQAKEAAAAKEAKEKEAADAKEAKEKEAADAKEKAAEEKKAADEEKKKAKK